MELQEARKNVCVLLIILFHPQKASTLIENLAFINLCGIIALGSQLHSHHSFQKQEFQNPCLHLVAVMTCSFSLPVVFFLLWKQGLRLWTSVTVPFQGRCHKIKSRLDEKSHLALNLAAKTKMKMYKLKHFSSKAVHQGTNKGRGRGGQGKARQNFTMLELQKIKSIVPSTKQKKYILTLIPKTFQP